MTYIDWIVLILHTIAMFTLGWFIGTMKEHTKRLHYKRLKKKMDHHFKNQSPEEAVKQFEDMGYEFEPIKQNKMSASDYGPAPRNTYTIELTERELAALYIAISTSAISRSISKKTNVEPANIAYMNLLDKETAALEIAIKNQTKKEWSQKDISEVFLEDLATQMINEFFKNKPDA